MLIPTDQIPPSLERFQKPMEAWGFSYLFQVSRDFKDLGHQNPSNALTVFLPAQKALFYP